MFFFKADWEIQPDSKNLKIKHLSPVYKNNMHKIPI
jgi:hypothetical protein